MTEFPLTINLDRPPYELAENTIRHTLRDLYGFVPPDMGSELALTIHQTVTAYQDALIEEVKHDKE